MNLCCRFALLLLLIVSASHGQNADYRLFTNTAGKSIRARLVSATPTHAVLAMENGMQYTLPLGSLSAADQGYITQAAASPSSQPQAAPGPNDKLTPDEINTMTGQSLFTDKSLWESSAEQVARRLGLLLESQTKAGSSFRFCPSPGSPGYTLFGTRPHSVALYAENDKVVSLSLIFANDADRTYDHQQPFMPRPGPLLQESSMEQEFAMITKTFSAVLGEGKKSRFSEGASTVGRTNVQRWDWRGHTFLLGFVLNKYVGMQIVPSALADAGGKSVDISDADIRARLSANVEKRPNGDVVVGDIPMVDQGPKGFCVAATLERALRYVGLAADMYMLAHADPGTSDPKGLYLKRILKEMNPLIRQKSRSVDSWTGKLEFRDITKHIDKGVPVIWHLHNGADFNALVSDRTRERAGVADWAAWKSKVAGSAAATKELARDGTTLGIVLIVGYNKDTNEIAFSDSKGNDYQERWISLSEAELVSQHDFSAIGY